MWCLWYLRQYKDHTSEEDAESRGLPIGLKGEQVVVTRVDQLPRRQPRDKPLRDLIVNRQLVIISFNPTLTLYDIFPLSIALLRKEMTSILFIFYLGTAVLFITPRLNHILCLTLGVGVSLM